MSRGRLPYDKVKSSALKKRNQRARQKITQAYEEEKQEWIDARTQVDPTFRQRYNELIEELGTNIFAGPPSHMLDPDDGSLDREKVKQLSKYGNADRLREHDVRIAELKLTHPDKINKRGGAGMIERDELKNNVSKDVLKEDTYRKYIQSIKNK